MSLSLQPFHLEHVANASCTLHTSSTYTIHLRFSITKSTNVHVCNNSIVKIVVAVSMVVAGYIFHKTPKTIQHNDDNNIRGQHTTWYIGLCCWSCCCFYFCCCCCCSWCYFRRVREQTIIFPNQFYQRLKERNIILHMQHDDDDNATNQNTSDIYSSCNQSS